MEEVEVYLSTLELPYFWDYTHLLHNTLVFQSVSIWRWACKVYVLILNNFSSLPVIC